MSRPGCRRSGNECRLEAVTGDQATKPCRIFPERSSGSLEKRGQAQLGYRCYVVLAHGCDLWLHLYPETVAGTERTFRSN